MKGTLLTIEDLRKRYGCGRDAATAFMREQGGFKVGTKWFIREERLEQVENPRPASPPPDIKYHDHASMLLSSG